MQFKTFIEALSCCCKFTENLKRASGKILYLLIFWYSSFGFLVSSLFLIISSVSHYTEYLRTNWKIKDFRGHVAIKERNADNLNWEWSQFTSKFSWDLLSFIFSSISRNEALVLETISFLSSSSSGKISLRFFSNKPLSMIKHKLSVKWNLLGNLRNYVPYADLIKFRIQTFNSNDWRKYLYFLMS